MTALAAALAILRNDKRSIASVALAVRRAFPFGQFGQAHDERSNNGATGCTDTCLQMLGLLLKRIWFTHDQIRSRAGNRSPGSGLTYAQVARWLASLDLPYQVQLGLTADQIIALVRARGPVMVGEMYGQHPQWLGFVYRGIRALGKANGFAQPKTAAGATQLGPTFRHAVLVLAVAPTPLFKGQLGVYVLEPNHGSSARPEQVPYDVLTVAQFKRLMVGYAAANRQTYAAVPTRALSVAA